VVIQGATFSASTSADGSTVRTEVSVINNQSSPIEIDIQGGGCRVRLLAYRNASRSGVPAWDYDIWSPNCSDRGFQLPLDAGESGEFTNSVLVSDVLGDSLPDGRYYFVARLRTGDEDFPIQAGDAVLAR